MVGGGNRANGAEAFRWTQATGMVRLGDLSGGGWGIFIALTACGGKLRWSLIPVSATKSQEILGREIERKTTGMMTFPSITFP